MQRRWLLRKVMRHTLDSPVESWPHFDGAILAGVSRDVFEYTRTQCKHVILCSGTANPTESPVVRLDDQAAGRCAAEHLIECRLERFSFYGVQNSSPLQTGRETGFRQTIEQRGLQFIECPLSRPSSQDWLTHMHRPRLRQWLRDVPKPIGIMAFDDSVAHDLADACVEEDIGVPEQVAIIGVNNDDLLCEGAWPPLSSVNPDYSRVGYTAAAMLEKLLAGEELEPENRLIEFAPTGVVQRQSTTLLAIGDPDLALALRFIREHACDPCSVHDVLRVVPVGRRWLERQFVAQLGRTPHDEITRIRVDTAKRMLADPNASMGTIASRSGFCDVKNLYVTFRKTTGMTPGVYRKSLTVGN